MTRSRTRRARAALAAAVLGLFIAGFAGPPAHAESPPGSSADIGCIRGPNGTGAFPRAGLAVANLSPATVRVWLESRPIAGLAETELGVVPPQATQIFPNALPSGRNTLRAVAVTAPGAEPAAAPRKRERIIYVTNHGDATCRRRYLWQIR